VSRKALHCTGTRSHSSGRIPHLQRAPNISTVTAANYEHGRRWCVAWWDEAEVGACEGEEFMKTMIVITHVLTSIDDGDDFVYVMREGCVVEQGFWANLEKAGGVWGRMIREGGGAGSDDDEHPPLRRSCPVRSLPPL
ncbi:hypothetical protein BU15DRAFT_69635, partial [Melanogaster broomeanus]